MALEKQFRSPHSPSPIYGDGSLSMNPRSVGQGLLRPGFTVGDLDRPYGETPIAAIASGSITVGSPTAISPHARVVKVVVHVTAGTGSVIVSVKSNTDGYSTVIFTTAALALGTYEFFVGGWSTPTDGDTGYVATKYGPTKAGFSPDSGNTTGDEDVTNPDPAADSNYVGGTYNPTNFLSLSGDDIKVYGTVSGTVTYSVDVVPVS